jgi:hypothetical protein
VHRYSQTRHGGIPKQLTLVTLDPAIDPDSDLAVFAVRQPPDIALALAAHQHEALMPLQILRNLGMTVLPQIALYSKKRKGPVRIWRPV